MTDTPFSPTEPEDDDLLASLYLDGEATPAERARVEADPRLLARVRAFETMASDLSSITPPPDLGRVQITAALDLFDQQSAAATTPTTAASPGVTSLTSLTERRERKKSAGIPTWLGVAAAAALVVGGLGFVSTIGGDDDDAASVDAAMEATDDRAASSTNRLDEGADSAEMAPEAASTAQTTAADSAAMEESADDAMDDDAMDGEAMESDASEEEAGEDDAMGDDEGGSADADITLSPIPLAGLAATTAPEYFELLSDQPLQPIADSPCAGSPLVEGLFGVDGFLPVVYEDELASLLVQEGVPSTAVIVGSTCEIELE